MMTIADQDDFNWWADFYRDEWGVNDIPAPTIDKGEKKEEGRSYWIDSWQVYKYEPITDQKHQEFKRNGEYTKRKGIALVSGKVWRGPHTGEYLNFIDADNQLGIDKVCQIFGCSSLQELVKRGVVVEQHKEDAPNKAHFCFYSKSTFLDASGIKGRGAQYAEKAERNELPALEIKAHEGLAFCTPSIHASGNRYKFIEGSPIVPELVLNEAEAAEKMRLIEEVYNEYGLSYFENGGNGKSSLIIPMPEMLKPDYKIKAGNNRHLDCLRIGDHFLWEIGVEDE